MLFEDMCSRDDVVAYISQYRYEWERLQSFEDRIHAIATGYSMSIVKMPGKSRGTYSDRVPRQAIAIAELRERKYSVQCTMRHLWEAFAALDWEEERVIRMRCLEGFTMTRIADELPASRQTAYNRLDSAIDKIARLWCIP